MSARLSPDETTLWQAVLARDSGFDGWFVYGVLTTGIYCRPSCPSREPKRENVRFYGTPAEAERDGLRACLRCRPLEAAGLDKRIETACATIREHANEPLPLARLAATVGLSAAHLQRVFKARIGVSPREYQAACRMAAFKTALRAGAEVTRALHEAGYGSPSRVYENAAAHLGMTPAEYRRGGAGVEISYITAPTSLGRLMLAATDRGVCAVQFGDGDSALVEAIRSEFPGARVQPAADDARLAEWLQALRAHLEGAPLALELPLDVRATAFQRRVWRYLQTIAVGAVQSYAEVAAGIGQPTAARAVARACATNRVAVVIPCHRVIRGTGALGGYRWGLERKRALLDAERRAAALANRPASTLTPGGGARTPGPAPA
jgi:AraC family transcriptional regulator of adaptative response/methylated-DNA-[protein]-cysteine methyltransferase